jgi:hypothetical protein
MALVGVLAMTGFGQLPASYAADTTTPPPANSLPPGHPSLPSQSNAELPAGHPSLPGQNQGGLPPGHPSLNGGATSRPASQWGTLILRTYQGTQGGPAIGEEPVTVEFYYRGQLVSKQDGKLDSTGAAVFQKIPLATPCQPLVKVKHGGIEYAAIGEILHGFHSTETLEMNVFESTDQVPQWAIQMRHLMIEPKPEGLHVIEMVAFQNPSDKSWLGTPHPDGTKTTFSVNLPAGVKDVKFEGPSDGIKIEPGALVAVTPMQPGTCQLQYSYTIPAGPDGKVTLPIVATANIGRLMCFVAGNGATATAEGLNTAGTQSMENGGKAQIFSANDVKPGQKASLTVVLPKATKASAEQKKTDSAFVAKVVAGVGGGIVLIAGTGYVLFRPGANSPKS